MTRFSLNCVRSKLELHPTIVVVCLATAYTLLAGLGVQFVVLDLLLPGLDDGHHLLAGSDSSRFHAQAMLAAREIEDAGWGAWSLDAQHQGILNLLTALYVVFTPEPWVMLPMNALIHGLGAGVLYRILVEFLDSSLAALPGVACFTFFPSALQWTSQVHQDGLFVLGQLLCMLGPLWMQPGRITTGLLLSLSGLYLTYLSRSYLLPVAGLLTFSLAVLNVGAFRGRSRAALAGTGALLVLVFTCQYLFVASDMRRISTELKENLVERTPGDELGPACPTALHPAIDRNLDVLLSQRRAFLLFHVPGNTPIDHDRSIDCVQDLFQYLPRATLWAVFSPFPSMWFSDASHQSGIFTRLVVPEVLLFYLALPFGLALLLYTRRKLQLLVLMGYAIGCSWIFVIAIPNAGSLYRYRWAYYILILGFGLGLLARLLLHRHQRPGPATPASRSNRPLPR